VLDDLRALIGLAHALAEGTLIEPIRAPTEKYPKVRVRLSSELTGELIHRLLAGELDVAAALLPEGKAAPPPLRRGSRLRICLTA
jgi:hypothetical protein